MDLKEQNLIKRIKILEERLVWKIHTRGQVRKKLIKCWMWPRYERGPRPGAADHSQNKT